MMMTLLISFSYDDDDDLADFCHIYIYDDFADYDDGAKALEKC